MSTRRVWNCTRQVAVVVLLAQLGCVACDPWPSPPPPQIVHFIAAFPDAIDVLVDDPSKKLDVTLVGQAYDVYGRVVGYEPLQFAIRTPMTVLALTPVSAPTDRATLSILPTSATTDLEVVVTISHTASGLSIDVPAHVHYAKVGAHGTAIAKVDSPWPSAGLASGQSVGLWQRNMMHAFIRRTGFGSFDASAGPPPLGDEASGTVLSSSYMLWRNSNPWTSSPADVVVPVTATRAAIPIAPVFAGSSFASAQPQFTIDLQGGADIIEHTLTGVAVTIGSVASSGAISWSEDCAALGGQVFALSATQRPSTSRLAVYMLKRSGSPGGDRALSCGPGTMGVTTGADSKAYAIFVPEGPVSSATIAHEIGHALSLQHVTRPSGFFDNDLMVETDDVAAVLRDRFTVGQAFRAALDPNSWLVIAGAARSAAIDCNASPMKCPLLSADISRRTPP